MPTLTTFIQHSIGSPSHGNQTRKRDKMHPNWKGRSKTVTICRLHATIYIENPKDATKKIVKLINEFSKAARCKINIQKFVAFLYMNNDLSEREIKKTIPFTIASKRIKYLGLK